MWSPSVTLGPDGWPGVSRRAKMTLLPNGLRGVGGHGHPQSWSKGSGLWSPAVPKAGLRGRAFRSWQLDNRQESRKGIL